MNANYDPVKSYVIDTGESSPNGKFWKNFFTDNLQCFIDYDLITGDYDSITGQKQNLYAIGFKKKGEKSVCLNLFPGKIKKSKKFLKKINPFVQYLINHNYVKYEGEYGVYFDHTRSGDTLLKTRDFSYLDIETRNGIRPVHGITFSEPKDGDPESSVIYNKIIYQRINSPGSFSRFLSRLSNIVGVRRPFIRRFMRRVDKRIKNEGVRNVQDKIPIIVEELEATGKYNAGGIVMDKNKLKVPNFEKFAFEE